MTNADYESVTVRANTKLPQLHEIPDGNILLIYFIRSNGPLAIFGENCKVSKDLVYSYVKAKIVKRIQPREIYTVADLVNKFDYQLTG